MKSLEILVIPGYRIFPVDSGGAHGQLTFLDKQQHQHSISLLVTPENLLQEDIPAFQKRFPELNLLPVGYKKKSATKKITAFFKKQYRKFSGKDLAYQLGKSLINGFIINDQEKINGIYEITRGKNYDLIQVEHVRNLGLVTVLPGQVKKIFIHHEIYHTRVQQDLTSLLYSIPFANYITSAAEAAELFWLGRYDGIITFNSDDTELLRQKGLTIPQQVAQPFALFDDELVAIYNAAPKPCLAFVGGEAHFPNKEGLSWFLQNILPLVQKQEPDVTVKITGRWSSGFMAPFANERVQFTGFIDDIDTVLRTAILVVPIRIGSGVRVKVFTAFAKGLPIISTTVGASGIPGLFHKKNVWLADNESSFAEGILELLKNETFRKEISANAFLVAKENFGNGSFVEERNGFYKNILQATGFPK
ncbi:MAG: glycosyltransferase [Ferruginibacter sp.]